MFKVQRKQCKTCIYTKRAPSRRTIAQLEDETKDVHGFVQTYRLCHHADDETGVCCRGFWDRHKDAFPAGQLAQRLNCVEFVDVDSHRRS